MSTLRHQIGEAVFVRAFVVKTDPDVLDPLSYCVKCGAEEVWVPPCDVFPNTSDTSAVLVGLLNVVSTCTDERTLEWAKATIDKLIGGT